MVENLNLLDDNFTRVSKKKKARGETKVYVSSEERKELIQEFGSNTAVLYIYYLEKSGVTGFDYQDRKASLALGLSERTIQRCRLQLTNAGWFKQITLKHPITKQKATITYLGKEMTSKVLTPNEHISLSENQEALCKALQVASIDGIIKNENLLSSAFEWIDRNT